jgi:hypothetical protein
MLIVRLVACLNQEAASADTPPACPKTSEPCYWLKGEYTDDMGDTHLVSTDVKDGALVIHIGDSYEGVMVGESFSVEGPEGVFNGRYSPDLDKLWLTPSHGGIIVLTGPNYPGASPAP